MFTHVVVGSNDLAKSKKFYDAVFTAIGGSPGTETGTRIAYGHKGSNFLVSTPINGEPACHANGGTIGFAAKDGDAVDAFYKAGIEAGGAAIEDPPGIRDGAFGKLHLAYLRDPSGNKVCALHRVG